MRRALRFLPPLALVGAFACSTSTPSTITITVSGGLDGPPFPTIATSVQLRIRSVEGGNEQTLATTPVSANGVDLPAAGETGSGSIVLAGLDDAGNVVAYGRTPAIDLSSVPYTEEAVTILIDRPNTLTRAISLPSAPIAPIVTMAGARFLVVSDANSLNAGVADLLGWYTYADTGAFDAQPITVAGADDNLLLLDASGNGTVVTIGSTARATANPPDGAAFKDVLGGAVVVESTDASWIVGGSRSTTASDVVMRFSSDGAIIAKKLSRPRTGVAAAWLAGRGLVLLGGVSPDGRSAPGVELASTSTATTGALPFPDDSKTGIAAAIDGNTVVRVRDDGVVESFDASCTQSCAPKTATVSLPAITPRPDDVALPLERGGVVVARAGKVTLLDAALSIATDLYDAGDNAVSMTTLSTGAIALVVANDPTVRTLR